MEKAAFYIYLIVLVISPLLFGAVHTYAYTIVFLGILVATALVLAENIGKDLGSGKYRFKFLKTDLNPLFLLLFIFLVFQTIPLPESILKYIFSESLVLGKKSLPASNAIIPEGQPELLFSLAPYSYPVRQSMIRWTAYGLLFWGLTQSLNSRKRIELAIFVILITGCFEALYGLIQTYSGSNHIWWFKKMSSSRDVCGTYINRNHLAGLMEMDVLLAAGFAAAFSLRRGKKPSPFGSRTGLRARIVEMLSVEQQFSKRVFIVFSGVIVGIGLIFSASRGGMIAVAISMLVMGLLLVSRKKYRRKGIIVLVLFVLTSAYAIHIGVEYPLGRFKYFDASFKDRTRYAQKTLEIFDDYRLGGTGLGSFQYVYPKYQAAQDKKKFFRFAHNDWVQFIAEGGIIGLCLLLTGIFLYIFRAMKLWRRRTDPYAICLGITPVAVITAVAVHSYSDFNLHIPANCLVLAAIMAIGYSALHLDRRHMRGKIHFRYRTLPLKYKGFLALVLISGLIIWTGFWTMRHFVAEAYCNTVTNSTLNRDQTPPLEEIKKAIEWDRYNAAYWFKMARELMRIRNEEREKEFETGKESPKKQDQRQMEIIRVLEKAVRLNPFNAQFHLRLGWEYTYLWRAHDYHRRWLPAADISMERAAYFAGEKNPNLHVEMGNYWVMRSKTIDPANPEWEPAWNRSCRHYQKALSLESGKVRKKLIGQIKKYVWNYYPDEWFVGQAVGDTE